MTTQADSHHVRDDQGLGAPCGLAKRHGHRGAHGKLRARGCGASWQKGRTQWGREQEMIRWCARVKGQGEDPLGVGSASGLRSTRGWQTSRHHEAKQQRVAWRFLRADAANSHYFGARECACGAGGKGWGRRHTPHLRQRSCFLQFAWTNSRCAFAFPDVLFFRFLAGGCFAAPCSSFIRRVHACSACMHPCNF